MIPVRSVKNQYRGINAHLHSQWQAESNWSGFHTLQIGDLLKALNAQLMHLNYIAEVEQSLQIRCLGNPPSRPKADRLIYDSVPNRPSHQTDSWYGQTQTIALAELLDEHELSEKPYRALIIYELDNQTGKRGEPVAWIELLFPSNKGNSEDAEVYRAKRMTIMVSGLVFVEIDYLNRTPYVDYRQLPGDFDQYSEADQARIANRMLTVLKAAKGGLDLEKNAPLPIENPISLQDALAQIDAFQ
jgi:Protein of unknown function (DUF4058)